MFAKEENKDSLFFLTCTYYYLNHPVVYFINGTGILLFCRLWALNIC